MQQSEPTPATDAVSAAMYEHFKTRAMTVNDIEGFLAHARQLERKARVMQRVLERIPSAIAPSTAPDEDGERYRWFRNECDWERRIEIAEYAEDGGHLDHHIDKGRCGL